MVELGRVVGDDGRRDATGGPRWVRDVERQCSPGREGEGREREGFGFGFGFGLLCCLLLFSHHHLLLFLGRDSDSLIKTNKVQE